MLDLVRNISRYSIVILAIGSIIMILYYNFFILEKIMKKDLLEANQGVVNIYKNIIWDKNEELFQQLYETELSEWKNNEAFINFASETLDYFQSLPAIKVNIYNKNYQKIISTNKADIKTAENVKKINVLNLGFDYFADNLGKKLFINNDLEPETEILQGKAAAKYTFYAIFKDLNGHIKSGSLLKSYIPIITANQFIRNEQISGIIEITQDISEQMQQLHQSRFKIFIIILCVVIFIYFAITYNFNNARSIVDIQLQENKYLLELKNKAENENINKSRFLLYLSNELRGQLNSIINYADIINNESYGKLENPKYKNYISKIYIYGIELLVALNDILDYSKSVTGQIKINCTTLDVRKIINSAINSISDNIKEAAVEFKQNIAEEKLLIFADQKKLKLVIVNLLSQAIKNTPINEIVEISVKKILINNDEIIEIIICDSGTGLSKKDMFNSLTETNNNSTDIILTYTQKLIEMMNATMIIESQLGKGTTVKIHFYASNEPK